MAYIMFYADRGRGALLIVYLVSFLFGLFRLRVRQLLLLAAIAIAGYGAMVIALYRVQAGDRRAGRRNSPVDGAGGDAAVVRVHGRLRHQAA